MTTRTPPPRNYSNFGKEPKENKAEISDIIDYNASNTNKAGINQPSVGGNNTTTTTNENRPVNRGYRHIPTDNYSALFDVEFYHFPYNKKTETEKKDDTNDVTEIVAEEYKCETTDNNKDLYDGLEGIGKTDMAYEGRRMEELEMKNKKHSAQIHQLERRLKDVRMENDMLKEQYTGPYPNNGFTDRGDQYDRSPERHQGRSNDYPDPRYSEAQNRQQDRAPEGPPGRRQYENEQHRIAHRHGGADEEPYWGFNRFYNPQYVTAYRREHIPYYAQVEQKEKQTQYDDDYNYLQQIQRRQQEEWDRKRREDEDRLMKVKDKPRTYEYTAPYQSSNPPMDINKYFHDSKHMYNRQNQQKPDDEYYFGEHTPFKQNPGTGLSTYERAYVAPRHGFVQDQQAGGLYIIRFEDSGYNEVVVSLRQLQTILKSNLGYILGIARKEHVYPIEGDPQWAFTKGQNQQHRHPKIRLPCKDVDDGIVVFWFPNKDKAKTFFHNSFHNRFREPNFPTTRSFEGHYIPLLTPPILRGMDTYLVIEIPNANRYYPQDFQNFQQVAREVMENFTPNCIPFLASAIEGRDALKPGPLFSVKSKVFISRFSSMIELSELWMRGTIQDQLNRCGLSGPRNVWAFSLQDWKD